MRSGCTRRRTWAGTPAPSLAPLGARAARSARDIDGAGRARSRATPRAGDHVLIMSNGGFGGLHGKLLGAAAAPGRGAVDADALPLFPLHTVLFPGGPLALRIFEPRYLDMVRRCLKEQPASAWC